MTVSIRHEVPFHDVDSVNVAWHGHYYKYFELARTALYRSINLDMDDMRRLRYAFPVIESHCRYVRALSYGQIFEVSASFKDWDAYVRINYELTCPETKRRIAYGYTKQAVCNHEGELLLAVPEIVTDAIER